MDTLRLIFTTLLVSLSVAAADEAIAEPAAPSALANATSGGESEWRRTRNGWERADVWRRSPSEEPRHMAARLHPGVVAAFLILLSVAALLALSPQSAERWEVSSGAARGK